MSGRHSVCSVQLADKFTAVFLCPTLSKLDGKPTTQLRQNVDRCRNKFLPAVRDVIIIFAAVLSSCTCIVMDVQSTLLTSLFVC